MKHIKIKDFGNYDIVVNNKLFIHICRNDVGYSVDLYKYDKYDEDENCYISTCTAWDDDIE